MTTTATAKTMNPLIGRHGDLHVEDGALAVRVEVLDVRTSWGDEQYLIHPLAGSGEKWVSSRRVANLSEQGE